MYDSDCAEDNADFDDPPITNDKDLSNMLLIMSQVTEKTTIVTQALEMGFLVESFMRSYPDISWNEFYPEGKHKHEYFKLRDARCYYLVKISKKKKVSHLCLPNS